MLILKSQKAYTQGPVLRILTQFAYGLEQTSCWSILVKRCINPFLLKTLLNSFFEINKTSSKFSYNYLVQATTLLQKNLDNAKASLEVLVGDLQFLRDQVTITQVTFGKVIIFPPFFP